jgi:hypothetical protein
MFSKKNCLIKEEYILRVFEDKVSEIILRYNVENFPERSVVLPLYNEYLNTISEIDHNCYVLPS